MERVVEQIHYFAAGFYTVATRWPTFFRLVSPEEGVKRRIDEEVVIWSIKISNKALLT